MNSNNNKNNKHEFAFFFSGTTILVRDQPLARTASIDDQTLMHRLQHVVRVAPGETFILFDRHIAAHCTLVAFTKRSMQIALQHAVTNTTLQPAITCLLPILKKDAFDTALYALAELGVTTIVPIMTAKTNTSMHNSERYEQILRTAAEQSKNFAYPTLLPPLTFSQAIAQYSQGHTINICFHQTGESIAPALDTLRAMVAAQPHTNIIVTIGPEGDFTSDELAFLKQHTYQFYKLTPTILRASQAITVAVALLRTLL